MENKPYQSAFHAIARNDAVRYNLHCNCGTNLKINKSDLIDNFLLPDSIMKRLFHEIGNLHSTSEFTIIWEGNEPTLLGIDFFKRVVHFQKTAAGKNTNIQNKLQTNGVFLDDKWCKFLHQHNFQVTLRFEGPGEFSEDLLKSIKRDSAFDSLVQSVHQLQNYKIDFNILYPVNSFSCHYPLEIYQFFRDELRVSKLHFVPAAENTKKTTDKQFFSPSYNIATAEEYGDFLIRIFDEWICHDVGSIFIQRFEGLISAYLLGYSSLCWIQPTCAQEIILEGNGDVYSCGYKQQDYLLGNLKKKTIDRLITSEKHSQLSFLKAATLTIECKQCEYLVICYGGCPKNRILQSNDKKGKLNWLCPGLKKFYSHTKEPIEKLVGILRSGQPAEAILDQTVESGVNDLRY